MDLDLNQQPTESPNGSLLGLDSLLNELETAHECIEERIRQLEEVTSRARQRQRWRQSQEATSQTVNISRHLVAPDSDGGNQLPWGHAGIATEEIALGTGNFGARNNTHLIARALSSDGNEKKATSNHANFFDCNICLNMAKNPILTCCGHLFCWPCFYQLSYAYSKVKECPVCMERVPDTGVIPIYGSGNHFDNYKCKLKECGLMIPPRPPAQRVESVRQQLTNSGTFPSPIEDRIQQFSDIIVAGGTTERTNYEGSQLQQPFQVSRLLLQEAASFSSLSSALNSAMDSAERLIEDLEEFIHSRHARRNHQQSSGVLDGANPITQSQGQPLYAVTGAEILLPNSPSSLVTDGADTVVEPENQRVDTHVDHNSDLPSISSSARRRAEFSRPSDISTALYASSSRRRDAVHRDLDVDSEVQRQPRRRRLR